MANAAQPELSLLEFHILLALLEGPRYGYALREAIEQESRGVLVPRAGSLYRVIARLMAAGFVRESAGPANAEPHPGLARKYYALTRSGRAALAAEARQLKRAAALAERRLGVAEGHS